MDQNNTDFGSSTKTRVWQIFCHVNRFISIDDQRLLGTGEVTLFPSKISSMFIEIILSMRFPKSVDCHRVWRWYSDTPSLKIHRARRPASMHKEFACPKNTTPLWKKQVPNPSTPSKLIADKSVESNDTSHGKSKLNPFFVCSSNTRNGTTVRYGKCWTGLLRKNLNKRCLMCEQMTWTWSNLKL